MRKFILAVVLLSLTACGQPKTAEKTSSSQPKPVKKVVRKKTQPLAKAKLADLIGHYFVDQADHDRILQFTASTSGYFMDVQTRHDGEDFATSSAGVFNAKITMTDYTYTIAGTAQPNAQSGNWQFQKLTKTKMQQLPDGPTYVRVKHDDLSTIN